MEEDEVTRHLTGTGSALLLRLLELKLVSFFSFTGKINKVVFAFKVILHNAGFVASG